MRNNRPIKQNPVLDRVEETMHRIGTLGTFMGRDSRKLVEIITDDQDMVFSLGLSHEEIARRLEEITKIAKNEFGDTVIIEDRYEVKADEARGAVPCPWGHPNGLFRKSHIEIKDLKSGERLIWTDLSIHLIRAHGFYQGKGSPYRLEPKVIKDILFS